MNDETELANVLHDLRFFISPPHPCSYLDEQTAETLFVDPTATLSQEIYSHLANIGFRRSGEHIYRPHCGDCKACVPVRIPVANFQANRSQRRTWKRNQHLDVLKKPATYNEEHYQLYRQYMQHRHPGGGMDNDDPQHYTRVISSTWGATELYEFREDNLLQAVACVDLLANGLSAVYTFFDPELSTQGLGVYAILWEIEEVKRRGLKWLYLGYWNASTQKMAYKANYRPIETFDGTAWRKLEDQ